MKGSYITRMMQGAGTRTKPKTPFGLVLDLLAEQKGLTMSEVAKRSGVHWGTISKARTGKRSLSRDTVQAISAGLFPLSEDERAMLYIAAGHLPPNWQLPALKRTAKNAGYDLAAILNKGGGS